MPRNVEDGIVWVKIVRVLDAPSGPVVSEFWEPVYVGLDRADAFLSAALDVAYGKLDSIPTRDAASKDIVDFAVRVVDKVHGSRWVVRDFMPVKPPSVKEPIL